MSACVLGSLALGYHPLWNRARQLAGMVLYATAMATDEPAPPAAGAHLLRTLQDLWSARSPPLLICAQTRPLLDDLLEQAAPGAPSIAVRGDWLSDPALCARVHAARQRGLRLVWRGGLGQYPQAGLADCFECSLLTLRPQDAVAAWQTARAADPARPALAGHICEHITHRALMAHCLDHDRAQALAGWPAQDILRRLQHRRAQQPAQAVILKLLQAIDAEQSLETFEDILGEDPLLAYRFLVSANSAALDLRTGISSLRRGLVMMGCLALRRWLAELRPDASTDPDMQPVRRAMVLRARLAAGLLDTGVGNELRSDIYLCGLLAPLDQLLGEPQDSILRRLPLSERIHQATVLRTGPYSAGLQMACALEGDDASAIGPLCATFAMELEQVNRTLLRVLSGQEVPAPAPGH
ncbi:HDOD domain-containing protein [Verminephrobacter eiseniae]|uniref:HDOD domain-containing protein n=1 Tax=Verminephrobacter eiseniae TaxID=364317 RepID=UPI002238ED56|nr:HDOD domain-containing protein [Verminephrobacter eiseniae]MCW5233375.1 HDOD domain-containing protein [Verminephrobacter eiseniae]MCW5261535.1 HDOD domain-containing protein [Verminephrobacter eiseniae]MCW5295072.1 HDOD domain-containing protein [Verminephrobacter eiseniae]MCW8185075.1 HDOD domain-containing protein [Verminephrobacter eiseniae]MCW8223777.1 HDOD domain-containing protein [Verminephrobacter eiseniae]